MIPRNFPDQAARFATTREEYARVRANIDREIGELRSAAVKVAVKALVDGDRALAVAVMEDLLDDQRDKAKIPHLEAIRYTVAAGSP